VLGGCLERLFVHSRKEENGTPLGGGDTHLKFFAYQATNYCVDQVLEKHKSLSLSPSPLSLSLYVYIVI
jgi:hypothetical protein